MYKISLVTVAFGALLINIQPAPAACHHYSTWSYPWPQPKCGLRHAPKDATYYVEIGMPPRDTLPLPVLDPLLPKAEETTAVEPDQRTPDQIRDSEEHDQALQAHKGDINKLMKNLHGGQ